MARRQGIAAGVFLLLVTGLLICPAYAGQPDPYLDFAFHLFKEGDYYRTITEAKRFLFMRPNHPRRVEAQMLIARAYMEAGQYDQARQAFEPVVTQKNRPDLAAEALVEVGKCLEKVDPNGDAIKYYQVMPTNPIVPRQSAEDLTNIARYRRGWILLDDGRWQDAHQAFQEVDIGHPLKDSALKLAGQSLLGYDLPYRSPRLAGAMSAVLPGSGQLYVGRPTDAALAFGLNAAFIWGTYQAYQDESWPVFGLLGAFELAWYGGNIYNAVNGAHIYNRDARDTFLKKLRREHGWRLGYMPDKKAFSLSYSLKY